MPVTPAGDELSRGEHAGKLRKCKYWHLGMKETPKPCLTAAFCLLTLTVCLFTLCNKDLAMNQRQQNVCVSVCVCVCRKRIWEGAKRGWAAGGAPSRIKVWPLKTSGPDLLTVWPRSKHGCLIKKNHMKWISQHCGTFHHRLNSDLMLGTQVQLCRSSSNIWGHDFLANMVCFCNICLLILIQRKLESWAGLCHHLSMGLEKHADKTLLLWRKYVHFYPWYHIASLFIVTVAALKPHRIVTISRNIKTNSPIFSSVIFFLTAPCLPQI